MSFLRTVGYQFSNPSSASITGGLIMAGKVAKIALDRRVDDLEDKYDPHLSSRLFDPQLYLSEIDTRAKDVCTKLASYPWFQTSQIKEYDSSKMNQSDWKEEVTKNINKV